MNEADFTLMKLSKAQDGDIVLIQSDEVDCDIIIKLQKRFREASGKNIYVVGMGPEDSIQLLNGEEARTFLRQLSDEK